MKTNFLKLSALFMIPVLTGCGLGGIRVISDHTTAIMSSSNISGSSISFSCQKCNGEIVYEIKVKENTDLNIYGNAKINLGALTITVKDESEEEQYYQDIIVDDMDFQIALPEPGKFHLSIIHDDFKGSYKLNWNK